MGLFDFVFPDEAQAFSVGKVLGSGAREIAGTVTKRSTKTLKGTTWKGKVISEVRETADKARLIVFEDGSTMPASKDHVANMCRAAGTEGKVAEFDALAEAPESQLTQAIASANKHYNWNTPTPGTNQNLSHAYTRNYLEQVKQVDPEKLPDLVYVWYTHPEKADLGPRYFPLYRGYAERLEQEGLVKIDRGRAQEQLFKPYRGKVTK